MAVVVKNRVPPNRLARPVNRTKDENLCPCCGWRAAGVVFVFWFPPFFWGGFGFRGGGGPWTPRVYFATKNPKNQYPKMQPRTKKTIPQNATKNPKKTNTPQKEGGCKIDPQRLPYGGGVEPVWALGHEPLVASLVQV